MYKELPKLVMYRGLGRNSILYSLSEIIREFDIGGYDKLTLTSRIYEQIRSILEISTDYGFDKNLWHDYLTYILLTRENPFTLTCERVGMTDGSVNEFALGDMLIFNRLFNYDFGGLERALAIDCFSIITDYKSVTKRRQQYNKNVSDVVRRVSDEIAAAIEEHTDEDEAAEETLRIVTDYYRDYGVGVFGLNRAFRCSRQSGEMTFTPITNTEQVMLDDLIGYDIQKARLRENTEAFLNGYRASNVLLFGDAGTGKSTSIKALINEYYDRGLRMIELYKHQMEDLADVISIVKHRNYKFIIYMDDLSFEEDETEYKYLKAVIEGGIENRPDNVLIYATSNRRNLIRETWNDISDIELDKHHSDTVQEKLSLVSRFGVAIGYMRPNQREFQSIVRGLAERCPDIDISDEKLAAELMREAGKWEVSHGGMTGRSAQQFIDYMAVKTSAAKQ